MVGRLEHGNPTIVGTANVRALDVVTSIRVGEAEHEASMADRQVLAKLSPSA